MPIKFHFQKQTRLSNRRLLKEFLSRIFISEKREYSLLNFIFCSNEYLLKINQDYLGHNYFTDIITFNLSGPNDKAISGEIYISVDMVLENAREYEVEFATELHRVIFHGVLHLCGYEDKSNNEKKLMRKREDHYLDLYFSKLPKQ